MRLEMTPRDGLQIALASLRMQNGNGRRSNGTAAMARQLGVTTQCISKWKRYGRIPVDRVVEVEKITGIARHLLRPDRTDLFPPPALGCAGAASHPR